MLDELIGDFATTGQRSDNFRIADKPECIARQSA
jgi:hypothetical protein